MTAGRGTYTAGTPDVSTFPDSLMPDSDDDDLIDAAVPQDTHKIKGAFHKIVRNNTGMLLIAASEAFYASMNAAVKKLNALDPPVSTMEVILVRMVITWLCSVVYMYATNIPDPLLGPKGIRLMLVLRGFCGFFGLFGIYYSLQYLTLADATVLTFLAPILTTFTGAYFLGEAFSWKQVAAGFCSLFGVVLIARPAFLFGQRPDSYVPGETSTPPADHVGPIQRLVAVGVALLGALGSTGAYTTIRAIGRRASPLHNIVAFSSQCVVFSAITMIVLRTKFVVPLKLEWMITLLMIGFFGFFAQVLMTMGLQREAVGRGTMAVYGQVVYAILFDQIFFATSPSILSILGILIIVCAAIYVAVTKEASAASEGSANRIGDNADGTLEEGLLANQEDADGTDDGNLVEHTAHRNSAQSI